MNFQSDSLSRCIDRMKSESLGSPLCSQEQEQRGRESFLIWKKKQCFLSPRQVVRMAGEQGRGHTHMDTTRTEIFKGESTQCKTLGSGQIKGAWNESLSYPSM